MRRLLFITAVFGVSWATVPLSAQSQTATPPPVTVAASRSAAEPNWQQVRVALESRIRRNLVDPESSRIEWPFGFGRGTSEAASTPGSEKWQTHMWTCCLVNARNRMGGYTGPLYFFIVIDNAGNLRYFDMPGVDAGSTWVDISEIRCPELGIRQRRLLPTPRSEFTSVQVPTQQSANATSISIADELTKLAALKSTGVLTSAEFEAAKAKLLAGH